MEWPIRCSLYTAWIQIISKISSAAYCKCVLLNNPIWKLWKWSSLIRWYLVFFSPLNGLFKFHANGFAIFRWLLLHMNCQNVWGHAFSFSILFVHCCCRWKLFRFLFSLRWQMTDQITGFDVKLEPFRFLFSLFLSRVRVVQTIRFFYVSFLSRSVLYGRMHKKAFT